MTVLVNEVPRRVVAQKSAPRLQGIYNPIAGQRQGVRLRKTFRALVGAGAPLSVIETKGPGDAERAAASACCADTDILIVAGGGGSHHEGVDGVMGGGGATPR